MAYPRENRQGNTESTSPGIPCAVTERATKTGAPRETTLEIPTSTIPGTPDPSYTPVGMNIFHQALIVVLQSILCWSHQRAVL